MRRIINMASNEGDLVLDPFMGGGTTIAVAEKLMRRWIGIDQSVQAVKVTEQRLQKLDAQFTTAGAQSAKIGVVNLTRNAKCDKISTIETI